jgi:putative drug exporter of the RND superfamily
VQKVARWSYRHRWIVVGTWLVPLVATIVISNAIGPAFSNDFNLPDTESTRALNLLTAVAPQQSGDTEQIVVATSGGTSVTDPEIEQRVSAMLKKVATLPHVSAVISPYTAAGAQQISPDKSVAFANVNLDQQAQNSTIDQAKTFVDTGTTAAGNGLNVAVSGQIAQQANQPSIGGMGLGIITAGIVLFLVFGSLFAMLMPLASALVALGTAISLIGLLSHVVGMPDFSTELVGLIGLGVGVDYALFIVSRHRQALQAGRDMESSVVLALDTSGRAVLFAGTIVCIALLGMFALGISFLYGLAVSASIGVFFTMIAALTFLPAMLGFVGPKILSRRQRRKLAAPADGPVRQGFWQSWSKTVERRPWLVGGAGLLILVLVATPFMKLRLGSSDEGNDPEGTTTRVAYDLLARGFGPGFNGPLQIVAKVNGTDQQAAAESVAKAVGSTPGVAAVTPPTVLTGKDGAKVAIFQAFPTTAPQERRRRT